MVITWLRSYTKRKLRPYVPYIPQETAVTYVNAFRMAYFFGVTSLGIYYFTILLPKQEALNHEEVEEIVVIQKKFGLEPKKKFGVAKDTFLEHIPGLGYSVTEEQREQMLEQVTKEEIDKAKYREERLQKIQKSSS